LPTALLWVETPSNPLLRVSDIAALSRLARDHGALLGCDNTFASPILQRPFEFGADLVMHSTTKYLGGHSDVLGGIIVLQEAGPCLSRLREFQGAGGGVPSPFDCWLLLRSLATLPLRVRAQAAGHGGGAVPGGRQASRAGVLPGLATRPGTRPCRATDARRVRRSGVLQCGAARPALSSAARAKLSHERRASVVSSLIEHRASMEGPHSRTPQNLLRLSIGIENVADLIADLDQALDA
jgi:cystathionine gamma-synthase